MFPDTWAHICLIHAYQIAKSHLLRKKSKNYTTDSPNLNTQPMNKRTT